MTHVLDRLCVVCGAPCRGRRCGRCVRAGLDAPSLWCHCPHPKPEPVLLLDVVTVPEAVQCGRCGRPVVQVQ